MDSGNSQWRIVSTDSHTGTKSLQFSNPDSLTYYRYPMPVVPCYPGSKYIVSAWIKTSNLTGATPGARIMCQWYDANNAWLGVAESAGIKGTNDWTQISITSARIPANAVYVKVSPYVTKGCTGKVWFDDVEISVVDEQIPNYVPDPGFENNLSSWVFPSDSGNTKWRIINTDAHSGNNCLQVENPDSINYELLPRMPITPYPGCRYIISAWVKTSNIIPSFSSSINGATIAVQWYGDSNNWLGYSQAQAIKGTNGWQKISFTTASMPKETRYVKISPRIKGSTGTAWFDDIEASVIDDSYFRTLIRYPNYPSTFYVPRMGDLFVGIDMTETYLHRYEDLTVTAFVRNLVDNNIVNTKQWVPTVNGISTAWFSMATMQPGEYQVNVSVFDNALNSLFKSEDMKIVVPKPTNPTPKVYIDQHNRCVADGSLFFPIGTYVNNSADRLIQLPLMAAAGLNCVLDYGVVNLDTLPEINSYLDLCSSYNMKAIFSLKDCYAGSPYAITSHGLWTTAPEVIEGMVDTFKEHPAILAWYINDEMKAPYLQAISDAYKSIKATDPNHPVYQVMSTAIDALDTIKSTDVIGVDDYPVLVSSYLNQPTPAYATSLAEVLTVNSIAMGNRAIWMVPEGGSHKSVSPTSRPPTYQEMLCNVYSCIIGGARGIIFYNWTDITADGSAQRAALTSVVSNIKSIQSIALGIDAAASRSTTSSNTKVSTLTRDVNGGLWVMAVNPYTTSASANFAIPAGVSATKVEVGSPGAVTRTITVTNNVFTDSIEPIGVRVYHIITE